MRRGPCVDRWGPSQHPGLHSTLLLIYRRGEGACLGVYRRFSGTDSFSIRAGRTAHPQQQALCLRSAQRLTLNLNLQLQAHPAHSNLILFVQHPWSRESPKQKEPEEDQVVGRLPERQGEMRAFGIRRVRRRGRGGTRGGACGESWEGGRARRPSFRGWGEGGGVPRRDGAEDPASLAAIPAASVVTAAGQGREWGWPPGFRCSLRYTGMWCRGGAKDSADSQLSPELQTGALCLTDQEVLETLGGEGLAWDWEGVFQTLNPASCLIQTERDPSLSRLPSHTSDPAWVPGEPETLVTFRNFS